MPIITGAMWDSEDFLSLGHCARDLFQHLISKGAPIGVIKKNTPIICAYMPYWKPDEFESAFNETQARGMVYVSGGVIWLTKFMNHNDYHFISKECADLCRKFIEHLTDKQVFERFKAYIMGFSNYKKYEDLLNVFGSSGNFPVLLENYPTIVGVGVGASVGVVPPINNPPKRVRKAKPPKETNPDIAVLVDFWFNTYKGIFTRKPTILPSEYGYWSKQLGDLLNLHKKPEGADGISACDLIKSKMQAYLNLSETNENIPFTLRARFADKTHKNFLLCIGWLIQQSKDVK